MTVMVLVSPSGCFALRNIKNDDEAWILNASGGVKHFEYNHILTYISGIHKETTIYHHQQRKSTS